MKYLFAILGCVSLVYGVIVSLEAVGLIKPRKTSSDSGASRVPGESWDWRGFFYRGLRWIVLGAVMIYLAYLFSMKG